ncbi:hypothetical protein AB6A40_002354 [Gnathostoma spinigerum]|uniref:Brain protein I3 n=1 Tax=Gnathostoma spinigerum TaxID=75299 RepID=A0ABD6EH49_9BILA
MSLTSCPLCKVRSVKKRFTCRGILYGIFCFPCGLYCCLNTNRQFFCPLCGFQVVYSDDGVPLIANKYHFYKKYGQKKTTATEVQPQPTCASVNDSKTRTY